jgi:flagellar basal-body rod protein FlgB
MLNELLFNATKIPLLEKGLDAYSMRHRAISDNVTNAETVGYKRRVIQFEENLRTAIGEGAIERTNPRHLGPSGLNTNNLAPTIKVDEKLSDVNDLNNVDIDREMADMAENHLQFVFASRMTKQFFDLIQTSIKGV